MSFEYMLSRQTQRVHEHRGHPIPMAMNSRTLLAGTAIGAVFIAVINNILQGGSTLLLVVLAGCVILASFIWLLFAGKQKERTVAATSIGLEDSIIRSTGGIYSSEESVEQAIPDPLDAGFDVPLM